MIIPKRKKRNELSSNLWARHVLLIIITALVLKLHKLSTRALKFYFSSLKILSRPVSLMLLVFQIAMWSENTVHLFGFSFICLFNLLVVVVFN